MKLRLLSLFAPAIRSAAVTRVVRTFFAAWVAAVARDDPTRALRRLLDVYDRLFMRIDVLAIDLDEGIHAKHRLIRYHEFFVERIHPGEMVLDVGTGKGELASDVAKRTGARVTGIDVNRSALAFARERFGDTVEWVEADVYTYEPDHPFDVLLLSNVLEHLDNRAAVLRRLVESTGAKRALIRVPLLERDWLVALRRDIGVWYYSDPTHTIEYDVESLRAELADAGLEFVELQLRWGEIWAESRPRT